MKAYINGFADQEDVFREFNTPENERGGVKVVFAFYDGGGWEGSAFVLFKKGRKLYEVHGSHCSCYGLEDQWTPEETTVKELLYRLDNGTGYWNGASEEELRKTLMSLSSRKRTTKLNP